MTPLDWDDLANVVTDEALAVRIDEVIDAFDAEEEAARRQYEEERREQVRVNVTNLRARRRAAAEAAEEEQESEAATTAEVSEEQANTDPVWPCVLAVAAVVTVVLGLLAAWMADMF